MTDQPLDSNMQGRINNMFSNQDLPAYTSLSEVASMKARIQELEKKLSGVDVSSVSDDSNQDIPARKLKPVTPVKPISSVNTSTLSATSQEQAAPKNVSFLRSLFSAPTFGDLGKNRIARLQHQVLLGLLFSGALALFLLIATWSATSTITSLIILVSDLFVLSLSFAFLRQGRLQLVSWILVALIYLVTISSLLTGSFSVTTVLLLVVYITLAGLLLKPRQVVVVIVVCIVTVFLGPIIDPDTIIPRTTVTFVAVILGLDGLLLAIASGTLDQSFKEVDKSTKALVSTNEELQDLTSNLEERVTDRTHDLELASEVGRLVTARVDNLSVLLSESVELIRARFNFYYTQVYLTDVSGRTITLRAGTGEAGAQLLKRGHHLLIGSGSLNGRAASEKQTVIVSNTAENPGFLPNPLLPKTRSEMAVPLIAGTRVVGVLDMQSEEVNVLNEENKPAFEALAGQLAVAIQNAALFEQVTQSRIEVEERAKQQSHANWVNFLNAIDRNEKIGYVYDQSDVLPLVNKSEAMDERNTLHTPMTVAGAEIGSIYVSDDPGRKWTSAEAGIISETATQLSRHIENLRLLAQSDKYRLEAEQVTKRLTREGWNSYLNSRNNLIDGYVYKENKVQSLTETMEKNTRTTQSYPIYVRDEMVGELAVDSDGQNQQNVNELISSVSQQLSSHIENLRLIEETLQQQGQLSDALTAAKLANWEFDFDRGVFIFNDNFYQIFHTTVKQEGGYEMSSERYADRFVYAEDAALVGIEIGKAIEAPVRIYDKNLEHRINYMDGGVGYMAVAIHIEKDENGKILRWTGANQDITERKEAESQLQESERRLQNILASLPTSIAISRISDGVLMYNNVAFTSLFGYPENEMVGKRTPDFYYDPVDRDLLFKELNVNGSLNSYELRTKHSDGHLIWTLLNVFPIRYGEDDCLLIGAIDVTKRKEIEESLANRADQLTVLNRVMTVANSSLDLQYILQTATDEFRALMQAFSAGVLMLDEKGENLTLTTESYADPNVPSLVGRTMPIATNPATDKSIKSGNTVLVADAQTDPILAPIHAVMKQRNIQSVLVTPLFSRDKIIGVFSVDTNDPNRRFDNDDITLIETLSKQLASAIESIQLFEETTRRAANLSTVAAVSTTTSTVLDPDELLQAIVNLTKDRFSLYHAHIYLSNEAFNTLLLAAGAGDIGKQMVIDGHSISMDAEQSIVARAARQRQAIIINDVQHEPGFMSNPLLPETRAEMAVPMIVGDNLLGIFDVQSTSTAGFSEEDASIYTTLTAQVAVALQNARLYMEQAATVTQLRELDRLKSSFLANMSHELRTPLNSILGFTDVMLEELDGPLTPNMDNDLKLIQKNGKHLLHLINDVLDMAKIESGKMNLIIEKFNLNETIEDVMSITSSLANEKSLALSLEIESDQNVFIRADHTRLRQVLINLVNNGIKFTEKGGVSVRVTHKVNDVLISVKDTGLGIPVDHLESIFQEFTQVDSTTTRKAGGTGLGLPISRRLIEMHGGKLWAESSGENGNGTTFHVLLPIEALVSEAIESEPFEKK